MTGGSQAASPPELEVVVVTFNTRELLAGCLRSLFAHPPGVGFQVTVVDNGSQDGESELVRRDWPHVKLIRNRVNQGFTRANNRALRQSRARYLLLINADAEVTPGCLDSLFECLEADPRSAVAGPRLVYADGSFQRWTAGREPGLGSALVHHLALDRLLPGFARSGLYLGRDLRRPTRVDWVSSACFLVRRSALVEVGYLDERIFTYMDDVDLCRRLRAAGWSVWYWPPAQALHHMGQSVRRLTGSVSPAAVRSFHAYFRRRHGPLALGILRAIEAVGFGGRAAAFRLATLVRRDASISDRARVHWTYFKLALERGQRA